MGALGAVAEKACPRIGSPGGATVSERTCKHTHNAVEQNLGALRFL